MKSYNTIKLSNDEDTTQELASIDNSFLKEFVAYMNEHGGLRDEDIYEIVPTPKRKKGKIKEDNFWDDFPPLW